MKRIKMALLCMCIAVSAMAQTEGAVLKESPKSFMNLYFGGHYYAVRANHKISDQGYELEYNAPGGFAAFEYALKGVRFMTEVSYTKGEKDFDMEFVDQKNGFFYDYPTNDKNDASMFDAPSSYTGVFYIGMTPFGYGHRFQLPLYFGLGGEFISGKHYNKPYLVAGVKVRGIYYLSNNVGLFAGLCYKYSGSYREYDCAKFGRADQGIADLSVKANMWGAEGGLTVMIGRKK